MKKKSTITVIVPFYKGNKYVEGIIKNISENAKNLRDYCASIELLFVNDSPEEAIVIDENVAYPFSIRCISAGKNMGIHGARCYGVKHAKGRYILMLDQDDRISNTWLLEQWKLIRNSDVVVSNVIYCGRYKNEKRYSDLKKMKQICNKWTLCLEGNEIVSPGQVLIRKDKIPREWLEYRMKHNGADDYLLWILLFEKKCRVAYNLNSFYYHQYSDESVSHRSRIMKKSIKEMAGLICDKKLVPWHRRVIYRYKYLK